MTIPSWFRFTVAWGLATLCASASPALAQLPPGKDCYAFPAGGKAGTTVEVRLGGSDWTPDVRFFVYDPRVKLDALGPPGEVLVPEPPFWFGIKSFSNDPRLPREIPVRFHLPADLPPGVVRWGVANANGAANGGMFVVGAGDEVTENESRTGPQDLATLPVTVNGRLGRIEEVDRYRFRAATSGLMTCDLMLHRLGNEFNGVLEVFAGDVRIAESVDTEGTDPVLTFPVEKGQTYTVTVRDIEYRGYRNLTYRLHLTPGPRLVTAVPSAGRPGTKRSVEFVGVGISTGQPKLERVTKEVVFPQVATGESFAYRLDTPHGTTPPFRLRFSDHDDILEPAGTDPEARRLVPPVSLTGRIAQRGERDTYTYAGKKGELWDIAVQAKQIGSPVDATLTVLDSSGKQLATRDYYAGNSDPRLLLTLPADGEYRLVVGDTSGKRPDLDSIYRLVIRPQVPKFTLRTAGVVNLPIGGKATLKVDLEREGGWKSPVTLAVTGLPEGVTVPKDLVIAPNAVTLSIPLACAATTGAAASLLRITGTATVEDRQLSATAMVPYDDDLAPDVLLATTMKPPFTVKSPDADNTRKAPRGATHLADLLIERTDGFTGEILLDMAGSQSRHRQGIRGPVFPVAPGRDRVLYPVTVPEWLETTRTSRIGLVAMANIPDPTGTPRWVMTAMDGQVTMSIEGAQMKLSRVADTLTAGCGEPVDVPLKLARVPRLTGPVRVELVLPRELSGLVAAAPLEWPGENPTAVLKLTSKTDPRLVGTWKLTVRATGSREGYPVVSETEIEIEFTRATPSPNPVGR